MIKKTFSSFLEKDFLSFSSYFSSFDGTIILFTGKGKEKDRSFLFLFPIEKIIVKEQKDPYAYIREKITPSKSGNYPQWAGFFSYEMGGYSDPDRIFSKHKGPLPLAYFQQSALVFVFHHYINICELYFDEKYQGLLDKEQREWFLKIITEKDIKNLFSEKSKSVLPSNTSLKYVENKKDYLEKIEKIQKEIILGNVYQANLSHEIHFDTNISPYSLFEKMIKEHPAPFSAFINLEEFQIVSNSPERFLKKDDDILSTTPIKGTFPRGKTPLEDENNYQELLSSEKDRAELLMITDLLRNDLSKVCKVGSVKVNELFSIKGYSNVWHLNSDIEGKAIQTKDPISLIQALFPGGSIAGCPKLASLELIETLEDRPRGIYTGSIGYFTNKGDFDFNIAIRTLLYTKEHQSLGLGGAIVIDSEKEKEYQETLDKGCSFFESLGVLWESIS